MSIYFRLVILTIACLGFIGLFAPMSSGQVARHSPLSSIGGRSSPISPASRRARASRYCAGVIAPYIPPLPLAGYPSTVNAI